MSILLSHLACCLMVAYTPAMTPNAHGSSPLLAQFTPTFDGEQALPNPALIGVVVAGPNAAPPGPFYAPRLICTAVAQLGEGVELAGRMIERCSVLVSNAAGNVTGTLAWLLTLLAMSPLFLIASSMAFVGRTARRLAERSYASASGGDQLPVSTSVLRASGSAALRARMQADIDKGRIDREEGQRLAMEQMLQRSTRSAPPGGQPIAGAAPPPPAPVAPQPATAWGAASSLEKRYDRVMRQQGASPNQGGQPRQQSPFPSANPRGNANLNQKSR